MKILNSTARRLARAIIRKLKSPKVTEVEDLFERRYENTQDLLAGHGIEIGPGLNPQKLPSGVTCTYFDKRDSFNLKLLFGYPIEYPVYPISDIPKKFPKGADFLIAHNVLEHSADPIGTLLSWLSYVRDDGLFVISLPEKNQCLPDAKRALPTFEHILLDHLLTRGEDAFESKEHIYSFLLGWSEQTQPQMDRATYVNHSLNEAQRSGHDLHWHALDRQLGERIIQTAGLLSGKAIEMIRICDINSAPYSTFGEVIFVFRQHCHRQGQADDYVNSVIPEIQKITDSLKSLINLLSSRIQQWSQH